MIWTYFTTDGGKYLVVDDARHACVGIVSCPNFLRIVQEHARRSSESLGFELVYFFLP